MSSAYTDALREWSAAAVAELSTFVERSAAAERAVVSQPELQRLIEDLDARAWIEKGGMSAGEARAFLSRWLAHATALHHPGFLAQQVAVPWVPSAIADLVHGVTNNGMAIYEMGPSAVALERSIVDWLLEKVGWPLARGAGPAPERTFGGGVLTHGGSLANLTAFAAARAAAAPDAWATGTPTDLVVLVPPSSHYSVARAAALLGMGADRVIPLEVDRREVVIPDAIPGILDRVSDEGLRVAAVVANACSTPNGMYDPLREIGSACRERGLWLHVDGAHGASALVSPRDRILLDGVELADSLSWDAHKMMGVSTLCAAALFRDGRRLEQAFSQTETYLTHGDEDAPGVDPMATTVECTKAPLALKLFLNLAAIGEAGMAAHIESLHDAARELATRIQRRLALELPFEPMSNIVCFRYRAPNERESDRTQPSIRRAVTDEGSFYIGAVAVSGRCYLRVVVMNPETTPRHMETMLDEVERVGRSVSDR
jgi:L-2,4-diaminobutyrate decarboxylase